MGRPSETAAGASASSGPAFLGVQKLPSVAGSGAAITGKLSFSAPTRIDGILRGEVRSTALLVIGEQGSVEGTLRAGELVVFGEVRGEIHVADRLEIAAGGRVHGNVEARTLIVNEGGFLDAQCVVRA